MSHSPKSPKSPVRVEHEGPSTFSRAVRDGRNPLERAQMATPSPCRYDANIRTTQPKAPEMHFPKGPRFTPNEFISKEHSKKQTANGGMNPGPQAYQPNIFELTEHGKHYTIAATRPSPNLYISRQHVQGQGKDSPGPGALNIAETSTSLNVKGPSYTFGLSDRVPLVKSDADVAADSTCHVDRDLATGKMRRTCLNTEGKHQHGGAVARVDAHGRECLWEPRNKPPMKGTRVPKLSPGPGFYSPRQEVIQSTHASAVIPKCKSHRMHVVESKTPSTMTYCPNYSAVMTASPNCTIGGQVADVTSDRFEIVSYKGKGVGERPGRDSPGPQQYNQQTNTNTSHAYSMTWRERDVTKHLIPGPARARLLSGDLARENYGMYSPGPRYMPVETWTKTHAPAYSFGMTDREFTEITDEHKSRIGKGRSPADVRFISPQHCKGVVGTASPGPASKLNPDYNALSTTLRIPKAIINTVSTRKLPLHHGEGVVGEVTRSHSEGPSHLHPNHDAVQPRAPSYQIPVSKRVTLALRVGGPGAGEYRPNYTSVEASKQGGGFGGLGARVPSLPKKLKL